MGVSRAEFDEQRRPRFGTANPERMRLAFWDWMLRGPDDPPPADGTALARLGLLVRDGVIKSGYGPYRARNHFGVPMNREDGPIWTFDRFGRSETRLPDGRVVCIGGEHEDWYDPDFHIYNDVVVFAPNGTSEIYGYPRDVFPPTDFHTATLVDDRILIVGCLGYPDDRRPGRTPVYALDPVTYRITEIPTTGDPPGWLFEHTAKLGPDGVLTLQGGKLVDVRNGGQWFRRNFDDFALKPRTGVWTRLTHYKFRQFTIRQADGESFPLDVRLSPEVLFASGVPNAKLLGVEEEDTRSGIATVGDGVAFVTVGWRDIEIYISAQVSSEPAAAFVEALRARLEAVVVHPCSVDAAE